MFREGGRGTRFSRLRGGKGGRLMPSPAIGLWPAGRPPHSKAASRQRLLGVGCWMFGVRRCRFAVPICNFTRRSPPPAGKPCLPAGRVGEGGPHSAFSRARFPLPFWQPGADGHMEQGRWERRKRALGRMEHCQYDKGKKGVKRGQLGSNSDKKLKKSQKKRPIRPCPS